MKNKLLILAMGLALTTQMIMAQVPSYVPTNGLVGYWPFSGNANDESGNGNNGIVNGATLSSDRYGNAGKSYSFNGLSNYITVANNILPINPTSVSVSVWFKTSDVDGALVSDYLQGSNTSRHGLTINQVTLSRNISSGCENGNCGGSCGVFTSNTVVDSEIWNHAVLVKDLTQNTSKIYLNGQIVSTRDSYCYSSQATATTFGAWTNGTGNLLNGNIDDIGIWNRALTQQEITNLYNSTSTNECLTMTINTGLLSTSPVTYTSTVNIYPNPANDQITIDCGNLANVVGWNIKITNMLGQEVFNQPMNTQQYVVPLNSWTGQGMYFVKIINAQNEVVNIKKIILQ